MVSDGKIPPPASSDRIPRDEHLDASAYLNEARNQAGRYLSAQADRIRAILRSTILYGVLGIAAAFVAVTVAIMGCVLLCIGIAHGIGQLLGGRQWAGELIAGGGIVGFILIGGFFGIKVILNSARRKTVESWATRKTQEPTL